VEPRERRTCCPAAAVEKRRKPGRAHDDKAARNARILNDFGGVKFIQNRPKNHPLGRGSAFVWGVALRAGPAE